MLDEEVHLPANPALFASTLDFSWYQWPRPRHASRVPEVPAVAIIRHDDPAGSSGATVRPLPVSSFPASLFPRNSSLIFNSRVIATTAVQVVTLPHQRQCHSPWAGSHIAHRVRYAPQHGWARRARLHGLRPCIRGWGRAVSPSPERPQQHAASSSTESPTWSLQYGDLERLRLTAGGPPLVQDGPRNENRRVGQLFPARAALIRGSGISVVVCCLLPARKSKKQKARSNKTKSNKRTETVSPLPMLTCEKTPSAKLKPHARQKRSCDMCLLCCCAAVLRNVDNTRERGLEEDICVVDIYLFP